jgi:uroporphyrinogen decarboxylase
MRATYEFRPVDRLVRKEFGIWPEALERWEHEGMPHVFRWTKEKPQPSPGELTQAELFGFDSSIGKHGVGRLGWCEPAFVPSQNEVVLEAREEYEIIRDNALRVMKVYKGRRHGFMPTYLKHAVTGDRDWHEDVEPLLDLNTPQRYADLDAEIAKARTAQAEGRMIVQHAVGGYMYLRALVGPEEVCYLFADDPGLIHKMMRQWLGLADDLTARMQAAGVRYDIFFIGEDICYNHGLLISPNMVREFILPYYAQILDNIRRRQPGGPRLHFEVDTDGNVSEAIDLYRGVGMTSMNPFEIAAGNDVVEIAGKYPDLVMSGGIDKRVLAEGPAAIDEYVERVIPAMVKRGGYYPTCDHGVPDNVSYASYMHYRKRIMELDH